MRDDCEFRKKATEAAIRQGQFDSAKNHVIREMCKAARVGSKASAFIAATDLILSLYQYSDDRDAGALSGSIGSLLGGVLGSMLIAMAGSVGVVPGINAAVAASVLGYWTGRKIYQAISGYWYPSDTSNRN